MASFISVPRDLSRVKSKILFNLTKRQLLCFGTAAAIGLPSFFALKTVANTSVASLGMILIMMPLFLLAMYEKDGQPMEVIARHFIETKFIRPKIRPYKTDNYYEVLARAAEAEKEVEKIVFHAEKAGAAKRKAPGKPDKKREKAGAEDRRGGKKK